MAWRSWMSAVVLIAVIAVAAFLRTFESNALCLTYVNSFVNYFVNLMEYEFVLMWVGDILCRFCYHIGFIVFNMIVNDVVPEVYAQLFAPANAVIEMDTAVPAGPLQPVALQAQNIRLANVPDGTVEPRQQEAANDVLPERRAFSEFMETLRLQQVAQEVAREEAKAKRMMLARQH